LTVLGDDEIARIINEAVAAWSGFEVVFRDVPGADEGEDEE
jgi:hypothetical protein